MDQVSPFLAAHVLSLLTSSPLLTTAEELLLRLNEEEDKVRIRSADPPFILVSSSGLAADQWSQMFGLYRKTTEITEDRSVYIQEHDTQPKLSPGKLFSDQGVWTVTYDGRELLRATTPSENPTSVKWQYLYVGGKMYWRDDPALTMNRLSEKPSCECEVTISLSEDVATHIWEGGPSVAGAYTAEGSYHWGRPVLKHSGGEYTLSVYWGGFGKNLGWRVSFHDGIAEYLLSGSAPSMCPADPRAARNERRGGSQWQWRYWIKREEWRHESGWWSPESGWTESRARAINLKCRKHKH